MAKVACYICGKKYHQQGMYKHQARCRRITEAVGTTLSQLDKPEAQATAVDLNHIRERSHRRGLLDAIDSILRELREY